MADHLDQLQPRHRIEEVQADQPLRRGQRGAQILQRDAGGVGGENGARLHPRLEPGIHLLLQVQPFRHRLDNEIGIADALPRHVRHQPVKRITHRDRLADDLAEQLGGALHRPRDRFRLHVREGNVEPLVSAPCRDIAAHGARAHDMHVPDRAVATCELLHLLAQEEHANQVLRRRRHHQLRERGSLGSQHRHLVAAMLFPEIDQGIGRRIMLARRRLGRLRTHATGEHAAHRREVQQSVQCARLRPLQPAEDGVLHGVTDMALLRHRIDQTERSGAAGVDGLASQH